jgi:hypothetical protein
MRKSAAAAVTASGVVALSALLMPSAFAAEAPAAPTMTSVAVNAGQDIVIDDLTQDLEVPIAEIAQAKAGVAGMGVSLWHGRNFDTSLDGLMLSSGTEQCTTVNVTTSSCTEVITIQHSLKADWSNPASENDFAGQWHVDIIVSDNKGRVTEDHKFATVNVLRKAEVTAEASRKQVQKGKNVTFTGSLNRVDLDTSTFQGYDGASAQLQFSKEGTNVFTTVATVKAKGGELSATVAVNKDGRWRWSYAGDKTTSTATSPVQFVNVV